MRDHHANAGRFDVVVAALLAAVVGTTASVHRRAWAQDTAPAAPGVDLQPLGRIRFNFKDTPFAQVLDVFARESGLPVIRQCDPPAGSMTFVGAGDYAFDEALTILNLNLAAHGQHLRRDGDYLYLSTLEEAARQSPLRFQGAVPVEVAPDQVVTVTFPLNRAKADVAAEKLAGLVAKYGSVTAVPSQNLLIVVETAAQARRLGLVIQDMDRELIDQQTEVFKLKYARAEAVGTALQALIRVREVQVIINEQRGTRQEIQDVNIAGLNFYAEPRTNSILVVGPAARIAMVRELIALLDVPDAGQGDRELMSFALETVTPEDAAKHLERLFQSVPADRKPTVIPIAETGRLTVVAAPSLLMQAAALIGEIDPGQPAAGAGDQSDGSAPERVARVVRLAHISPAEAESVLTRLLSPRQARAVKFGPTPDQRGLVVAGPTADADELERLIAAVDAPRRGGKEIRQVTIAAGDPAAVLRRAAELHAAASAGTQDEVTISIDADSRTATLIGPRDAVARFESAVRAAESTAVVESEARSYDLANARPSEIAPRLARVSEALLRPSDGSAYAAPAFDPLDEFGRLIVRATPDQFAVIDELVSALDRRTPGGAGFRIIRVGSGDPAAVAARALALYRDQSQGLPASEAGEISAEADAASGAIIVRGTPGGVRLYGDLVAQVEQLTPPPRTTRIIDVRLARAADLLAPLNDLLASADPIDPSRAVPAATISALDRTNSLVVTAEEAQHAVIADLVQRLDRPEAAQLPPLKLLQLRAADAAAVAAMLQQQYDRRPQADRAERPVMVQADAATSTLIVSAHPEVFEEIRSLVQDLNTDRGDGPDRVTELFPLQVAKAADVAAAMDKLYPQPPMPVDRLGRPQPWLQQPKEVTVSAEPSSNSLIIDAPADRMESLRELAAKLDRVELPPMAELRTFRIVGADLQAISRTLSAIAARGGLAAPAQPGRQPVQVVIETEPRSSTLIVAGDATTFERVEAMLADLSAVPVEKGLRVVPIATADAAEVRSRALAIYDAQVAQIPGANPVDVTVDESSNSLMVVADAEAMQRFMAVMDELQRQAGPAREVRLLELRHARAAEVIGFLEDLVASSQSMRLRGGPAPVFEAIEATNTLLVAAQPAQFAVIDALVKSLDAQRSADRPPLRLLQVRASDAVNLASTLQRNYDSRPSDQRSRLPVEIQADAATNTLVISAHPDVMPEIEAVVTELNEFQAVDAMGREIRIFPLRVARAADLARTIDEMFPEPPVPVDRLGRPQPHLRPSKEVFVRADAATNSLIVDAPAQRLAGFEQIVRELDKQRPADDVEVRTYRLRRADLAAVRDAIQNLASSGALGATGQSPVTVSVEPASGTLVVSGPAAIFDPVGRVIAEFDQAPDAPASTVKIYTLARARAERLQPMLQQVLATRAREQSLTSGRDAAEVLSLIEVAADRASNSLIVSAPEAIQQVAGELIRALDDQGESAGRNVLRVTPLSFADAAQVAQTLTAALPTMDLPAGGPVTVLAVAGSNSLLLGGAEADLKAVEALLAPLDARPEDPESIGVEAFELTHADAATISQTVQRLLIDQQETDPAILRLQLQYARNRPDLFKKPAIRVEAEARTNSLVVSGPRATLELARELIARLDRPAESGLATALTFTPARAAPDALARAVSRVVAETVPSGRRPVELVVEPATGSIIAIGTAEQAAAAVKLLAEFDDRSPAPPAGDFRLFTLRHADAAAAAQTLGELLADRSRWPDDLRAADRAGVSVPAPTVRSDPGANRLLVSAPTGLMDLAAALVRMIDEPSAESAVDVLVVRLSKGDAASVAAAVQAGLAAASTPGEPAPVVTAEPSSNSVLVAASPARAAAAMEMIRGLDQAVDPAGAGVRTIVLRHARAEAILPTLESVLKSPSVLPRLAPWMVSSYLADHGGDPSDQVRLAAERRLNAIVVSAPVALLDVAEQLVRELDVDGPGGGEPARPVRVIPLANAEAAELAATIESVFADEPGDTAPPTVRVDTAGNALIVRGTPDQLALIDDLARRVDGAAVLGQRQLRFIPIDRSRADAALMAETLRRLLEQQGGVTVEVVPIDRLLEPDPPATAPMPTGGGRGQLAPGAGVHAAAVVAVWAMGPAVHAQDQPEATPAGRPGSQPGGADPADGAASVVIGVDPRTNSLVVVGSPRLTDRLAALAQQIEAQMPAEPLGVRVVPLPESADARALADLLTETVRQVGRSGADRPGDARSGGFTGPVSVMADPTGSALIVWANETDFRVVGQVIASVARLDPTTPLTVKIYPLEMITADKAADAVRDLLTGSPSGRQAARVLDLRLASESGDVLARIDPSMVRATPDPGGASLIVAAPADSFPLLDRFIGLIDQSPVTDRLSIRRYELANADAGDLSETLQALFDAQRQGPGSGELPRARFVPDGRTNSILATAADAQHADIDRLIATADAETRDDGLELRIFALQNASAQAAAAVLEDVVVGDDPGRRDRVRISAAEDSDLLVVRADGETLAQVAEILATVDVAEASGLPMRSIKLDRADAQQVASALQRFFADRARASSRRGEGPRLAIVGDRRSGTLVVSASDEDFAQVTSLVETFDAPAPAADLQWRIIRLEHARAKDLDEMLQDLTWMLQEERVWGGWNQGEDAAPDDKLFVNVNEATNSVVVMGQGQTLDVVANIVAQLDQAPSEVTRKTVRVVPVPSGDMRAIASAVRQAFQESDQGRWWFTQGLEGVTVETDATRRLLILVGRQAQVEEAAAFVRELAEASGRPGAEVATVPLRHADAGRVAESLRGFFRDRARLEGHPENSVSVTGSADGNVLIASAAPADLAVLRDLVAQIDQPELTEGRRIEVFVLQNRDVQEAATAIRGMFPTASARPEARVLVTPQPSTGSLIVSAPADQFDQVEALVRQLDAGPTDVDASIVTVRLATARAADVAAALAAALPPNVKLKVTPVARSNSIMLTGSREAIAVARSHIETLDTEPAAPAVEFRRVVLEHATAYDVYFTLQQMARSRQRTPNEPAPTIDYSPTENAIFFTAGADEVAPMLAMIGELDVPQGGARRTEFVKLDFAPAEQAARALEVFYGRYAREARTPGARAVTIVPDPITNTLLISADDAEWADLTALIDRLDTEEYDTERRMEVIALNHADAASVAEALHQGLRAPLEDRLNRDRARAQPRETNPRDGRGEAPAPPTVLVDAEDLPSVSAEPQTNSLIVFATPKQLDRIRLIAAELDRPDFDRSPAPQVIAVARGRASAIAEGIRAVFSDGRSDRSPRRVIVYGHDASSTIIVRAEEGDLAQIRALAEALQAEAGARTMVRILPLRNVPAARLKPTIESVFRPAAEERGEALAVEVDRAANALAVASSEPLFEEIRRVAAELDGALPGQPGATGAGVAGPGVFIIDVKHNSPQDVLRLLEQMGVTGPQPQDRPGLVSEPVTIVPLTSRAALAVVAGPRDGAAIVEIVRAVDAEPAAAAQSAEVVALKQNTASRVVDTVRQLLGTAGAGDQPGPARALAEHIRRLNMARQGAGQEPLTLDLTAPVRLIADDSTNSVVVSSAGANTAAVAELVRGFDTLPVGDAVVVRIFPLANASAPRARAVVEELFRQGEALRRLPGTERRGLPTTATGQALAGEIAVSVDERTNALLVAGREEAVALVEVLVQQLDSDEASSWVEPTVVPVAHADPVRLAETLRRVLVSSTEQTDEAMALRRQVSRLRVAEAGGDARVETDLFAPMDSLVIEAEESLRALIVVATPANVRAVTELVRMLDVEAAAAGNTVRLFPLEHAAADRVAAVVAEIFRSREQLEGQRPEDRVAISVDARTNALVASTSPRSFAILEGLVRSLDGDAAAPMVGLHVIPLVDQDAEALAPKVDRLMRDRIEASRRDGAAPSAADVFSVQAEPANNVLIVAASDENLRVVRELVAALAEGRSAAGADRTDIISVGRAPVAEVAQSIRELYADRENERRGDGSVGVIANDRLNALVVSGTEADHAAIRDLVARFAGAKTDAVRQVRRIELRSANALEVVALLQNVLAGRPLSGRSAAGQQATRLVYLRDEVAGAIEEGTGRELTEAEVDGAIRDQVTLTPDLRTNSVYVAAPEGVMKLVADMIGDLDGSRAGERKIEKFRLVNADARAMADLLRDLFKLEQQGDALVLVPTRGADDGSEDEGPVAAPSVTPVPDDRQELSITVDARTNTLLVSGTPDYLDLVREVVKELDEIRATERERLLFRLRNATAAEVESTLQQYFQSEADSLRQLLGAGRQESLAGQLEREVTVVGDDKSNTVLVSASPRYIDMVRAMIDDLDRAPPQVMIQVLLAEVTLDSEDTWGADFNIKEFGGDMYSFGSLAAGAGVAAALGVPHLSFASSDFDLLIRALQAQGRLEVLSNPNITVNNNESALIQVGQNIAVVEGFERLQDGNTRANLARRDVGIILNVTPTISADGFVRMDIEPEISAISAQKTQISEDLQSDIINQRRVSTVVTVKDGQTVVIGGLRQSTEEERKSKVPIVGEIPGIGLLFQSTKKTDVKTELLVILTPRVIPGESGEAVQLFDSISRDEIERINPSERLRKQIEDMGAPAGSRAPADSANSDPAQSDPAQPDPIRPGPSGEPGGGGGL